jgi:arylsulfatase A-like enzyme
VTSSATERDATRAEGRSSSRRLAGLAVAGAAALLIGLTAYVWREEERRVERQRWNVVLITFDTTRADHLSCYGYKAVRTPVIDQLAAEGMRYTRCFSPVPLTLPTHASILTGLYPYRHGVHVNGEAALADEAVTLAEILKRHGWATAAFVGAYPVASVFGLAQGFDTYDEDFGAAGKSRFFYVQRNAQAVSDAAIAWLDGATTNASPYFLWVHYYDPHAPYEPPGYNPATATNAAYDLEIAYTDQQLGRLLERVDAVGRAARRETLVIFTADHGESLWNHGEPTHGLFCYNDTLHVPLIVRSPALKAPNVVVDEPVSVVDIFPSVLRWLGVAEAPRVDGRLLPEAGGAAAPAAGSSPRAIYFETQMPLYTYGWSPLQGVILGADKLIVAPRRELYDLDADWIESQNLFDERDPRVAAAERALRELTSAQLDAPALTPTQTTLDAAAKRSLEALGYATGGAAAQSLSVGGGAELRHDPKDMVSVHRRIDEVQVKIEARDYSSAMKLLHECLAADADNLRAFHLLYTLLADDASGALAAGVLYERTRQPVPAVFDTPERFMIVALRLEQAGRRDEALELYEAALARDGNNLRALNNSAWILYELRREPDRALQRATLAVAAQPDDASFRDTLGCVLLWRGQQAEALAELRKAVELVPQYAAAHYHLGLAEQAAGSAGAAIAALERAVALAGEPAPAWLADASSRLKSLRSP